MLKQHTRSLLALALLTLSSFTLVCCATLRSNTFTGAMIGATVGSVGGVVIGSPYHSASGAFIGAASGAAVGALIGYLTEPKNSSTNENTKTESVRSFTADQPSFSNPEVRQVWIPDKIDGNKYIKGHYEYVLERGSVWTMP